MFSDCGAGEDSWESLGLQGNQTSQSKRKATLNIHWKDWCWNWSSNTLATSYEESAHRKRPWCWERLRQKEKGAAEDEMVKKHHWLNGHEFEQIPGYSEGQGSLSCCSPWVAKNRTWLTNWTMTTTILPY